MTQAIKRLLLPVALLVVLYAVGIYAYHGIEGWGYLDCVYFLTATFTTVGFGDFYPLTATGKMMTIFFMWAGVGTALYLLFVIHNIVNSNEGRIEKKIEAAVGRLKPGQKAGNNTKK
jgi:hypothetical protein